MWLYSIFHRFISNHWENSLGFQILYESTDETQWIYNSGSCGGSFTTPNGFLTSPSYPYSYPSYADCFYTISQPIGTTIVLTFQSMNIHPHPWGNCDDHCGCDYLEIRDGSSAASPFLVKLCGNEIPAPIQSTQNQVWMK